MRVHDGFAMWIAVTLTGHSCAMLLHSRLRRERDSVFAGLAFCAMWLESYKQEALLA
jgi:hypothetical protein